MNHLLLFENWGGNRLTLYHGAQDEHDFSGTGSIAHGTFFSDNQSMAADFGTHVYAVTLRPETRIFDACEATTAQLLIDRFGTLYNTYYEEDEDGYEVADGETLANDSDNWDILENNDGVLDWIMVEGYDGVCMCESGYTTYLLFEPAKSILTTEKIA